MPEQTEPYLTAYPRPTAAAPGMIGVVIEAWRIRCSVSCMSHFSRRSQLVSITNCFVVGFACQIKVVVPPPFCVLVEFPCWMSRTSFALWPRHPLQCG